MTTSLTHDSFIALAAVAWADQRMSKDEASGLVHAARAMGLSEEDVARVEEATKAKVDMSAFDASALDSWQRLLTYGIASWLTRLDGVQQAAEVASLAALASALESEEVTAFKLKSAASAAFDTAMAPAGSKPDRYDFAAFEKALRARLPSVK